MAATLDNRLHEYLKVIDFIQHKRVDEVTKLCNNAQYKAKTNNKRVKDSIDELPSDELFIESSEEEKISFLIKPYFDSISLYMGPTALDRKDDHIRKNLLSQITLQNFLETQQLFDGSERYYPTTADVAFFNADQLKQYIIDLATLSEGNQPLALTLYCDDHAVFLGYYNGQWYFVNHDKIEESRDLTNELMQSIISSMNPLSGSDDKEALIAIQSYTRNKNDQVEILSGDMYKLDWRDRCYVEHNRLAMAEQLDLLDISDKLLVVYVTDIERAIDIGISSSTDTDMLHARSDDTPALYFSFLRNNLSFADVYLSKVLASTLPHDWKVELLLAKDKHNLPVLYQILRQSNRKAIDLYVSHILNSDLPNDAKNTLLIGNMTLNNSMNISAINANLAVGQMAGVRHYVTLITQTAKLSPEQKQNILVTTLSPIQATDNGVFYCRNGLSDFVNKVIDNEQVREQILRYERLEQFVDNPLFLQAVESFYNANKLDEKVYSILSQDQFLLRNTTTLYETHYNKKDQNEVNSEPDPKDLRIALLIDLKQVIVNREVTDTLKRQLIHYAMSALKINHKNSDASGNTTCFNHLSQYISLEGVVKDIDKASKAIKDEIERAEGKSLGVMSWLKSSYHNFYEQYANIADKPSAEL
ncbi:MULTISPECIES: hypothetical protein [Cysteiniphilum]|uniref:hypothetical protein n=1 Tax=Cysteiniphilum TaxID=2056696 RepID=UPI00177FD34D|nr:MULTISPECIES: hypothetical protein [Cysteiniphilum]